MGRVNLNLLPSMKNVSYCWMPHETWRWRTTIKTFYTWVLPCIDINIVSCAFTSYPHHILLGMRHIKELRHATTQNQKASDSKANYFFRYNWQILQTVRLPMLQLNCKLLTKTQWISMRFEIPFQLLKHVTYKNSRYRLRWK